MRQSFVAIACLLMLSGCELSPEAETMFSSGINGTGGQLYVSTPNSSCASQTERIPAVILLPQV